MNDDFARALFSRVMLGLRDTMIARRNAVLKEIAKIDRKLAGMRTSKERYKDWYYEKGGREKLKDWYEKIGREKRRTKRLARKRGPDKR